MIPVDSFYSISIMYFATSLFYPFFTSNSLNPLETFFLFFFFMLWFVFHFYFLMILLIKKFILFFSQILIIYFSSLGYFNSGVFLKFWNVEIGEPCTLNSNATKP